MSLKRQKIQKDLPPSSSVRDDRAFDFFFRKYYPALCFFATRILRDEEEAKDVVQDCFVKLWNAQSFDHRSDTAKSFLYASVRNACIDLIRKKKVREQGKLNLLSLQHEADNEYLDEITFAEMMRQVVDHMHELPPKMQQVLTLHYLKGKKYNEIADELQTSADAVRMQKNRAIKIIRRKLLSLLSTFFFF